MLESNEHVGERLVKLLAVGHARERLVGELLRLRELARKNQAADFRECLKGVGIDPVARAAVPERVLVKLHALPRDPAKDHSAELAVADRQRAVPIVSRRLAIPEF
jgi:hypothetical protein